jgi:hypothetical protein
VSEADVDPSDSADANEGLNLQTLARNHAGLLIAGGVAAGALLAVALTPSSTRRKLAKRTLAAATAAGEAGLKLGRQGAEKLEGLGETIAENAEVTKERAAKAAGEARGAGLEMLRAGLALIAALRR